MVLMGSQSTFRKPLRLVLLALHAEPSYFARSYKAARLSLTG
jgi:hypothetical protein